MKLLDQVEMAYQGMGAGRRLDPTQHKHYVSSASNNDCKGGTKQKHCMAQTAACIQQWLLQSDCA